MSEQHRFVAKWYTRAARVRLVIAKLDGRWTLPGGPYPIPELITLVGGIIATLFTLPHTSSPFLTAVVGLGITSMAVSAMRKMPYSPVPFPTRAHRIARLYTNPVSISSGPDLRTSTTVSVVRAEVEILDSSGRGDWPPAAPDRSIVGGVMAQGELSKRREGIAPVPEPADGFSDLFDHTPSPAADLFG